MKSLGGTLFLFGVGSSVLHLLGREFVVLLWVDLWGPTVGWAVRIALALVGSVLWLAGNQTERQTG